MEKIAIAYIPVLHRGYVDFVTSLSGSGVSALYVIGDDILAAREELDYLHRKDRLRALSVTEVCDSLTRLTTLPVFELTEENIMHLQEKQVMIITPKEDIGRIVVDAYFKEHRIEMLPVFLRWNKDNAEVEKEPEAASLPMTEFQKRIVHLMHAEKEKSFDWWRQVSAALVKGEEIICVTHNEHMPEAQTPNIEGDVRSLFKKGLNINLSTAAHAEVVAIGSAAKEGIKTKGAEIYTTDFPCPYCARLMVSAGIQTVYFLKGYAMLEGDTFLKEAGVKVVRLTLE